MRVFLGALAGVVLGAATAWASSPNEGTAPRPSASPAPPDSRWELRVEAVPSVVLPGEPVLVLGTLTYRGEQPFFGKAGIGPGSVTCRDASGAKAAGCVTEALGMAPQEVGAPPAPGTGTAHPAGWMVQDKQFVLCGFSNAESGLSCPRTFVLSMWTYVYEGDGYQARVLHPAEVPAVVHVLPLPAEERNAYALWSGAEKTIWLLRGDSTDLATVEQLATLVARYHTSRYADYARVAVAQDCRARRGRLVVSGRVPEESRREYLRLAAEEEALLRHIVDHSPNFALLSLVTERLRQAEKAAAASHPD